MTDLTKMSNEALQKQVKEAQESRARIEALDSHKVVESGQADAVLAELEAAGKDFTAAKAELARPTKQLQEAHKSLDAISVHRHTYRTRTRPKFSPSRHST